jgi:DNA repair protein RecO (recombination protein O)
MENEISTPAIVLNRRLIGEADRLVVLYTPHNGKLKTIAKGAARAKSRRGPLLEPLCELDVLLYRKRENQDFLTLKSISLLDAHSNIKASLPRTAFAMLLCETIECCSPDHNPHPEAYDLLRVSLRRLKSTRNLWGWALSCQLHALALLGLFPRLTECARCGGHAADDPVPLSARNGGIICAACRGNEEFQIMLPRRILDLLTSTSVGEDLPVSVEEGRAVEQFLRTYLEYHLEWKFKSLDFIASIKQTNR